MYIGTVNVPCFQAVFCSNFFALLAEKKKHYGVFFK